MVGREGRLQTPTGFSDTSAEISWSVPEGDPVLEAALVRQLRCTPVLARLLWNRGVRSVEDAERFLNVRLNDLIPPSAFKDADKAVERIRESLRRREKIAVFGDYDVDGVSGTAIVVLFLRQLGADVRVFLPHRVEEGYGLSRDAVERMHNWGARLVVTVDNGSAAAEEIALGRRLGMDFVVTDHHETVTPLDPEIPALNPKLPGESYPFRELAGAAVAFKLVWALARELSGQTRVSESFRRFLWEAVGLVALGTVADVMPLVGENRIFAHYGLRILSDTNRPGIAELRRATCNDARALKAYHVAFRLAPPLNAAGRLGEAHRALELLLTEDPKTARELVAELRSENDRRRQLEQAIVEQAQELAAEALGRGDPGLVLAHREWHVGVVGIAAARLAERVKRPVILLSLDHGIARGSGRSYGGIPLYDTVAAAREHLLAFGGHSEACGLRLRHEAIDSFRRAFCEALSRVQAAGPPPYKADMVLPPHAITGQVLEEIERLAPFGPGNQRPVFVAQDMEVLGPVRDLGRTGSHLEFLCKSGRTTFRCVYFGGATYRERVGRRVTVAYRPVINDFRGVQEIELHIQAVLSSR